MLTKNCTKCNIKKLESEFYSNTRCKLCRNEYNKERHKILKSRNKADIVIPDKRVCISCGEEKHGSKFYIDLSKPSGLRSKCIKCHNRYIDFKRRTDPKKRAIKNISKRYRRICKDSGVRKNNTTIQSLGCSGKFFAEYIEARFKPGMNWWNYGAWHIDHIRPWASIDMSNKEEVAMCCHYTNMQPLWANENLVKGDKWPNFMSR